MPLGAAELTVLIDRHAAPLRLWAGQSCFDPDDAVQQAFCRLATLDATPDRPVAWLYTTVRNNAISQFRSRARRQRVEQRAAVPERQDDQPAAGLMAVELVREVEQLDDRLREVLVARIWGELTLEEIATLCGISPSTACRHYQSALEQLRNRMESPCLNRIK